MEFIHPVLNVQVDAIGGHYTITREERLPHTDGEILYFAGHAVVERSCCGPGGCGYALVAGHIVSFCSGLSPEGRLISVIETVRAEWYTEIAKVIRLKEGVNQVHFLCTDCHYEVVF